MGILADLGQRREVHGKRAPTIPGENPSSLPSAAPCHNIKESKARPKGQQCTYPTSAHATKGSAVMRCWVRPWRPAGDSESRAEGEQWGSAQERSSCFKGPLLLQEEAENGEDKAEVR